jgi:hypothetical protein
MNSLIKLWNILSGLADSLAETKELIDAGNARIKQSLGIDAPPLKLIDVSPEALGDPSPPGADDGRKRRPAKAA